MDGDSADPIDCISWYHMGVVSWKPCIYLCRPGTIGQDEVKAIAFTIFFVVFKADELNNRSRLEPLFKERGFIKKLKQGSAVPTVFTVLNVLSVLSILTVFTVFTM